MFSFGLYALRVKIDSMTYEGDYNIITYVFKNLRCFIIMLNKEY